MDSALFQALLESSMSINGLAGCRESIHICLTRVYLDFLYYVCVWEGWTLQGHTRFSMQLGLARKVK